MNKSNNFKLGLYFKDDTPIIESIFDAEPYQYAFKNELNFSEKAKIHMRNFFKVLSKRTESLTTKNMGYDYVKYPMDLEKKFIKNYKQDTSLFKNDNKANLKYILSINGNIIIERNFVVYNYNPISRFSLELTEIFNDILNEFKYDIKEIDLNNQWDEYEKSVKLGISLNKYVFLKQNNLIR